MDESKDLLQKFSQVALRIGVNLQNGQNLLIDAQPEHYNIVQTITEEAYRIGARLVEYHATTPELLTKRATNSKVEYLNYTSKTITDYSKTLIDENWAILGLKGKELSYEEASPQKLSQIWASNSEQGRYLMAQNTLLNAFVNKRIQGSLIATVSPSWAAQVLGGEANRATEKKFWDIMKPILRLDKPDPVAAWRDHISKLKQRCKLLDTKHFTRLHFIGDGTDLWINPMKTRDWGSAVWTSEKGIEFTGNIPTEEVGIAPDFRETEGTMFCPISSDVYGTMVENAWFVFEHGKVVDYGAECGKEALDSLLNTDDGARYAGEAALVDVSSPISRSNHVFGNILLDENASCHVALGSAYPPRYAMSYTPDQLREIGCNVSRIHYDFMIGSKDTTVYGIQKDGSQVEIMHKGEFTLE